MPRVPIRPSKRRAAQSPGGHGEGSGGRVAGDRPQLSREASWHYPVPPFRPPELRCREGRRGPPPRAGCSLEGGRGTEGVPFSLRGGGGAEPSAPLPHPQGWRGPPQGRGSG